MTNPYATIRAALESIRVCDDMTGEREAALAALAELEKASKEPVGEVESSPFGLIPAVDTNKLKRGMKLYTTPPPAPVVEIRDAVITDEMCDRAYIGKWRGVPELIGHEPDDEDRQWSREWLEAWRSELGPALGLVEIREPTPEECADMAEWFKSECLACCINSQESADYGRAIFDAVKIVMWPKSEGS